MQTFLPLAEPRATAAVLDDRRLGKQRVETLQILRALTWERYGWRNHPAVRMWRGFVPALVHYGVAVCDEWAARGYADVVAGQLPAYAGGRLPGWAELRDTGALPWWLGREDLHASHRSALLRKDPEHYRRHFPDEPDDLPYVWPPSAYPRWPLRRGGPRPVDIGAAAELAGVRRSALPACVDRVVAALRGGDDVTWDGPDGPLVALLAALCLPGRTAWVVPGAPLPAEGRPPAPYDGPLRGRPAVSVARPPGPDDLARMAAEGLAPELVHLRPHQLGTRPPDLGLVVLDDQALVRPPWRLPALRLCSGLGAACGDR